MKKSFLLAAAAAAFTVGLSGCSKKADGKIKIGIIQLVEHTALDANYKGFVDGLAEAGYENGKNISIDYQNAQNEQANCATIAQKFINDQDDLIFAIATPAAQAVANLTKNIPVVVSSVTDPESAKLVKSNAKPGTNVTGTSDLTPCEAQIGLLKKIVPDAKTVECSTAQTNRILFSRLQLQKQPVTRLDFHTLTLQFQTQTNFSRLYRASSEK